MLDDSEIQPLVKICSDAGTDLAASDLLQLLVVRRIIYANFVHNAN
jgi:hypothetical protein